MVLYYVGTFIVLLIIAYVVDRQHDIDQDYPWEDDFM